VQKATGGTDVEAAGSDGIDYEAVAAARPDLILAIYEGIDQPTYDRLSKIAPTVVQSADYADEETPWDVQLLTTGKALSREDQVRTLVEQVDSRIAEAKAAHPAFAGKVLVEDFGPENGGHYLIGKGDPRRTLFDALGFDAQETTGDVSEEQLSLLDRDVGLGVELRFGKRVPTTRGSGPAIGSWSAAVLPRPNPIALLLPRLGSSPGPSG
jgi:iron complex transport system substrate-binding protein